MGTVKKSKKSTKSSKSNLIETKDYSEISANINMISGDQDIIQKLVPLLENFNQRLLIVEQKVTDLEKSVQKKQEKVESSKKWTEEEILPFVEEAYHSCTELLKDQAPIPWIITQIQERIPIDASLLEDLLYSLFIKNKIDLQPGKVRKGTVLIRNNHSFYWLKLLEEK